jgi:hypothetical protein
MGAKMVGDVVISNQPKGYFDKCQARKYQVRIVS